MCHCLMMILVWARVFAAEENLVGTWRGETPGSEVPSAYALVLEQQDGDTILGRFHSLEHHGKLKGELRGGILSITIAFGGGVVFEGKLTIGRGVLTGIVRSESLDISFPIDVSPSAVSGVAAIGIEPVDFEVTRPQTVFRNNLPESLRGLVVNRIQRHLEENGLVGLATAVFYEGRIADLRCSGWEDFANRVPVNDKTMFRWASISKPLTAIAAMQLVELGLLDLDRDVRDYVPEFPEKKWPITSRQLLAHHAGMVHYQPGLVIVTEREYDVPHPFSDRILALDKFKESALLHEPGTHFSYSTPGYALLGAVIQRAGGAVYEEQVRTRILKQLGMTNMQPDYPQIHIPRRTLGYKRIDEGITIPSGDSDVSWKLAAGGWISTITNLARFGEAILNRKMVTAKSWDALLTPKTTTGGKQGSYGFGFNIKQHSGVSIAFHSGAQRKTQTMLMLCPDQKFGVAIMSNTEGVRHESVCFDLMEILAEY